MPAPKHRSRSMRRVFIRTPGSRRKLQYRRKTPSKAHCGLCRKVLAGVARAHASTLRNIPKSKKTPSRPYRGNLCPSCSRKILIEKARKIE